MSGIAVLELSCIKDRAQIYANTSLNQPQPAHAATTQICTGYLPPPLQRRSSKTDNTCMMFILIDSKGACLKL